MSENTSATLPIVVIGAGPSGLAETGIERAEQTFDATAAEFPPWLDLVAPVIAVVGLVAGALDAAGAEREGGSPA